MQSSTRYDMMPASCQSSMTLIPIQLDCLQRQRVHKLQAGDLSFNVAQAPNCPPKRSSIDPEDDTITFPMQLLHGRHILRSAACSARLARPVVQLPRLHAIPVAPTRFETRRWYTPLDFQALDAKWQKKWKEDDSKGSEKREDAAKDTKFVLPMFPYPSGTLHLGHLRVYTIADVVARYRKLKGDDVVLPMGWDAFGLPAENAALERGIAPGGWTRSNIKKMSEQLECMNGSWNWDRELTTCEPEFYKHTQKLFLMLHEAGLAYQAEAEVNYDPVDKTVLANEQVDANGRSWRSGAVVEKKKLKQWFFRISEYSQSLLDGLDVLGKDGAWPERVLTQQRNWLGKSKGAKIKFPVMAMGHEMNSAIEVFTTRPDTLFGVQYVALAATHPTVVQLAKSDPELAAFLDTLPGLPPESKVGYLLPNLRAINPLAFHEATPDATKASVPVYVAPYVLGDYGEGAVMGVPGHDLRDHAFWKTHNEEAPVRIVLAASEDETTTAMANEPYVEHGHMTEHSGPYKGKPSAEAGEMMVKMLEDAKLAESVEQWRLRDWLISRQRYWGTPIPVIHCDSCGAVPVPDEDLPVKLPDVEWQEGSTGNALESLPEFVSTTCPKCKGPAKRDTDTMDTFVDSSWYYARFADPHNEKQLLSPEAAKMLPVDVYLGGIEHAILHLLYARFIYKFLAGTDVLPQYAEEESAAAEPFKRLITQGMVQGKTYIDPDTGKFLKPDEVEVVTSTNPPSPIIKATGKTASMSFEKMSKSKHNGVDPTDFIAKYGADPTRAHMIFQAPVGDPLNWDEEKVTGVLRWMEKLHKQVHAIASLPKPQQTVMEYLTAQHEKPESTAQWDADTTLWRTTQRTVRSVTDTYDEIYFINTVVSDLMNLTNTLISASDASPLIRYETALALTRMLYPIAPALASECHSILSPNTPITTTSFPVCDESEALTRPKLRRWTVQVNGKFRANIPIDPEPENLAGDDLGIWVRDQILKTEEGQNRFTSEGGAGKMKSFDVMKAKRVIALPAAKVINFVGI